MKKSLIIPLIVITIVVFVSGCSFNAGFKTFDSNGITFQYPYSWDQLTPNQLQTSTNGTGEIIAVVADPESQQNNKYQALTYVQRSDTNVTLSQAMNANKAIIESSNGDVVSEQIITVNGVSANELIYTFNAPSGVAKKERLVAFEKNNQRYYIICSAPVNGFDTQQNNFNMIINSFKVK
jgi:hypothetical protein